MATAGRALRTLTFALLLVGSGTRCSTRDLTAVGNDASSDARLGVDATSSAAIADPIAELRPFEATLLAELSLASPPSAETGLGADPWALRRLASGAKRGGSAQQDDGGPAWVGILRGRSALVLLDEHLRELARVPAPRSPTGLAVSKSGDIFVVGELSPVIARFAVRERSLALLGETRVPGVFGLRDVAVSPTGAVWVLDEHGGRALKMAAAGTAGGPRVGSTLASVPVGHGATQIMATAKHVIANAVTEHEIVVITTDALGAPTSRAPVRIKHDGPMWGFDARETDDGLVVAAGGVEDHPLDRREGFFGWIDSFVFVHRLRDAEGAHLAEETRIATIDVSEHGVVTPKAISIEAAGGTRLALAVAGYGSANGLRIEIDGAGTPRGTPPPSLVTPLPLVPGVRTVESAGPNRLAMANPLLDAWVLHDAEGLHVVPVAEEASRTNASWLGEVLFFTSLMAPRNTSAGAHSRFTCETCHFEGYVDGRTHHTGRGDVHATTKPLVGLVGNRPYFSRAMDPDLATIAHAEFRVAGAGNPVDPFFAIEPREHGWLEHVGVGTRVEALDLRRALMRYLAELSHRPNPAIIGRTALSSLERAGAVVFRDRCEGCHAARLSADDAATRIPFERWEAMIVAEAAPLVWGSAGYRKTGITPYVHEQGARTPSLRRLYKKYPYFTNGSAHSSREVLDRMGFANGEAFHADAPSGAERLDEAGKRALLAFLELL